MLRSAAELTTYSSAEIRYILQCNYSFRFHEVAYLPLPIEKLFILHSNVICDVYPCFLINMTFSVTIPEIDLFVAFINLFDKNSPLNLVLFLIFFLNT